MPNHVYTTLRVTAPTTEQLRAFMLKASTPYTTYHTTFDGTPVEDKVNSPFTFTAFLPFPTEPNTYWDYKDENGKLRQPWYDWNVSNWGTKWDAYEVEVQTNENSPLFAVYRFTTAWSPPIPVFEAIAQQHPEIEMDIQYEEEQGWGGEIIKLFDLTELSVVREWDIPNSHADYVARDNEDGCICGWEENPKNWYKDCPPLLPEHDCNCEEHQNGTKQSV